MSRRNISGFLDSLPEEEIAAKQVVDIVRKHFELAGGAPISTPAFEKLETLLMSGEHENSHEIYGIYRLGRPPETEKTGYGLAFDLTIPLARYVAQHSEKLIFPFRRYQIQRVWRGERPQAGRHREFTQADFDIIGRNRLDALADAEVPAIINRIFDEIGINNFKLRVSNLKLLGGYVAGRSLPPSTARRIFRTIDKIERLGHGKTRDLLVSDAGLSEGIADELIELISRSVPPGKVGLALTDSYLNREMAEGVNELETLVDNMIVYGIPRDRIEIDLSIVRGMEYYTGTVYEVFLAGHNNGSVCSGGRYENLVRARARFPGVGMSIGITRLVQSLIESGIIKSGPRTPASVLVTVLDRNYVDKYVALTNILRDEKISAEMYLGSGKIGDQLRYASRKGFLYAVILGADEISKSMVQVRDLVLGEQSEMDISGLMLKLAHVRRQSI